MPEVAPVTKVVHVVYDASVTATHSVIRLVARGALGAVDLAFDLAERSRQYPGDPPPGGP